MEIKEMMNVDDYDKENLSREAELLADATPDMDGGVFLKLLDSLNGFGSIEIKDGEVLAKVK